MNANDDIFVHLTNHAINVTNEEYIENKDANARYGHKWSLKTLWAYLSEKGIDVNKIWEEITDLIIKTIIW